MKCKGLYYGKSLKSVFQMRLASSQARLIHELCGLNYADCDMIIDLLHLVPVL